jgi:cystathionine beta-lyase/cystathionine gamma-synthase
MDKNVIDIYGNYSRNNYPSLIKLKNKLSSFYNVNNVNITTSGMNAINQAFMCKNIDCNFSKYNLIFGNELYYETKILILNQLKIFNPLINYIEIDIKNRDHILALFRTRLKNKNNVLFIESCTNPNGYIFDYLIIEEIRSLSKSLLFIVDNTWLTSIIFNPFEHGADIVITSLTKYYSDGTCIAGAILCKDKKLHDIINEQIKITGIHIYPELVETILSNIISLDDRVKKSSTNTIKILDLIKYNQKIKNIKHPYLPNHPSYILSKFYFKNELYPSVFTMELGYPINKIKSILNKLENLECKTSFGSPMSRIDTHLDEISYSTTRVRISIGYADDIDNIMNSINELLSIINK